MKNQLNQNLMNQSLKTTALNQCSYRCTHLCVKRDFEMLSKTKYRNKKLKSNK
jgi:hypothetical protein